MYNSWKYWFHLVAGRRPIESRIQGALHRKALFPISCNIHESHTEEEGFSQFSILYVMEAGRVTSNCRVMRWLLHFFVSIFRYVPTSTTIYVSQNMQTHAIVLTTRMYRMDAMPRIATVRTAKMRNPRSNTEQHSNTHTHRRLWCCYIQHILNPDQKMQNTILYSWCLSGQPTYRDLQIKSSIICWRKRAKK